MTILLKGKEPADKIKEWVKQNAEKLKNENNLTPCLATIQFGDDQAASRYVRSQIKACESVGISAKPIQLPSDIAKKDFAKCLEGIANDNEIDGIIIETPIPKGWNFNEIIAMIPPSKDVEGITPENLGRLYLGEKNIPLPCTAHSAILLLEYYGKASFEGQKCVVVGRSANVGRAVSLLLMHRNGTVSVCHTKTDKQTSAALLTSADVVVAAAGAIGIVNPKEASEKAWIVDVGINVNKEGKLVGDVAAFDDGDVAAVSPVPGGVGPLTVAVLLYNLLLCAAKRRLGIDLTLPALKEL